MLHHGMSEGSDGDDDGRCRARVDIAGAMLGVGESLMPGRRQSEGSPEHLSRLDRWRSVLSNVRPYGY